MKWLFEEDGETSELTVVVKKACYDQEVQALADYLTRFGELVPELVPVKTADKVQLVKVADLILVEVEEGYLRLRTVAGDLLTVERLYKFQDRVKHPDLVQISKQALINIKHLDYLEASFSGNMTAFLTKGTKTSVSRRYLKNLEEKLGL